MYEDMKEVSYNVYGQFDSFEMIKASNKAFLHS